jgi:microcystin-dependent protein
MAEPFLSEIRIMSFEFAPGLGVCNGQLCPSTRTRRCSPLGTTYGGDGRVNFATRPARSSPHPWAMGTHSENGLGTGSHSIHW